MHYIIQGITALIVFIGICSPIIVIGVIYYLKKRLEHKQIMAAIEKGTPISEIMPPKPKPAGPPWIRYLTLGIALLIIGVGFTFGGLGTGENLGILVFFILAGIGAAWIVRGLLHRKYYLKNQLSEENSSTEKSVKS